MSGYLLDMRPRGAGGGSSGAPVDATYITQTPNATLTNEQALSLLATGLLKNTTGTGILSIATPTIDFASAAQGALADTAVQPGDLSTVAFSGDYGDLLNLPTLGTMAAFNDAPSDGSTYGRNNGAWASVVGGVSSVFARTGAVISANGDYTASQVTNVPAGNIAGVTVQAALNELDGEKAGLALANVFTALQKINVNNALALLVEQDGVRDNVLVVDTTNGRVGVLTAPTTYNFEVIGITDAATAIFNSVSAAIATRVVIQGTAANGNADNTDPILSLRNRSGTQVALIREDGLVASSFLGTLDNASVFLVDDSVDTASYPKGVNLGSTAILGWASGLAWFNAKDITLSRIAAGQLRILCEDAVTSTAPDTFTVAHNTSGTPAAGFGSGLVVLGESSTTINQYMARLSTTWATATHASRKARSVWTVYDTAEREGIRIEASGTAPMLGFYGTAAVAQQTVAGSRGGNAALADLLTKLATLGLIIDGSSA